MSACFLNIVVSGHDVTYSYRLAIFKSKRMVFSLIFIHRYLLESKTFLFCLHIQNTSLKRPWNWTLYKSKVRAVSFYYTLQSVNLRFFLFVYFLLLVGSEFSDLSSSHDHKESKDHFRPFREGSLQFLVLNVNLPHWFFLLSYNRSFECVVEHSFPLCKWFPNSPVAWL